MTYETEQPHELLRPVLDTYLNSPLGITGCRSYGYHRPSCEYDVVVVSDDSRSPFSLKNGPSFIDVYFMSEKELLLPSDPEVAVALSWLHQVRDSSLTISASASANRALLHENANKAASNRLAAAVKALARADDSLAKGLVQDGDMWLLSSGYEFAQAWILSTETAPSPSHILDQTKGISKGKSKTFEAFSKAVGLERASRSECKMRLDALSILYDVMTASRTAGPDDAKASSSVVEFEIVKAKTEYMTEAMMHVDCYAYLGFQVYAVLPSVSRLQASSQSAEVNQSELIETLSRGDRKMIGEQVIRGLGLGRTEGAVKRGAAALQSEISLFAKSL